MATGEPRGWKTEFEDTVAVAIGLRVQVARLEERNAVLEAALRDVGHTMHNHLHPQTPLMEECDIGVCPVIRAALSSDAGKGWLPPEVRKQAEVKFNYWKALRIWDIGEDWEKQGCRCCIAAWKPGEPAQHTEDCCFHPAPAERPWR